MTKIVLHIGGHKTGSTVLQHTLAGNSGALQEQNWSYPLGSLQEWQHRSLFEAAERQDDAEITAILMQAYFEAAGRNILFSSEYGQFLTESQSIFVIKKIRAVFPAAEVSAVYYIRRQDDLFESMLNQQVKLGSYSGDIEEIISRYGRIGNYFDWYSFWTSMLGEGSVFIRPYVKNEKFRTDIVSDFSATTGITLVKVALELPNHRLAAPVYEMKRLMNHFITDHSWDYARSLAAMVEDISGDIQKFGDFGGILSRFERTSINKLYSDQNTALFARLYGGVSPWGDDVTTPQKSPADPMPIVLASMLVHITQYIQYRTNLDKNQ